MTQMTVWLDDDANPAIIKKVLQNMKGVGKISLHKGQKKGAKEESEAEKLIKDLH